MTLSSGAIIELVRISVPHIEGIGSDPQQIETVGIPSTRIFTTTGRTTTVIQELPELWAGSKGAYLTGNGSGSLSLAIV